MQKAAGRRPRGTQPARGCEVAPSGAQRGWGGPPKRQEGEEGGAGRGHCPGLGPGAGSRSAADRRQAPVPPSGGPAVCPSTDRAPPKPPLEDLGAEVRQGTYRRISCLVRNVKSWKAKRKGFSEPPGGHARSAAGPEIRLPRPGSPARPARKLPGTGVPRTWYSANSSLDRRLPELPIVGRAHSSANLPRGAGNFSTSALGPRHCPVPAATAPGATAPGPAPSLKCPGAPCPVPPASSRLRAVLGELEAGPGARSPGRTAPPPEWAGRAPPRASGRTAHAFGKPQPRHGPARSLRRVSRCVLLYCCRWCGGLGRGRGPRELPGTWDSGKLETRYVAEARRGLLHPEVGARPQPHVLQPACHLQK